MDMVQPPPGLHGRQREWEALIEFVGLAGGARLGLVYGRRRQGKTHLLQALHTAVGGLYWQAIQQSPRQNLEAFSATWSEFVRSGTPIRFATWAEALAAIMAYRTDSPWPITFDEVGYLIASSPEFPSVLQAALAPFTHQGSSARLLLCGSSFGQMRRLVDASAPLRGRAHVELSLGPFDFREAAEFWGLMANPNAALQLHALVGGTPAYRDLAIDTPSRGNVAGWAQRRLLDPRSALFREGRIAIAEDTSLGDPQLFWGVIGAIAMGAERRVDIAAAIGRPETSLGHALTVLTESTWVRTVHDPLRANRTRYRLADPMVRFWRLVTEPNLNRLTGSRPQSALVWRDTEVVRATRVLAPHLEDVVVEWLMSHADEAGLAMWPHVVGPSHVGTGRAAQQIDLVAVARNDRGADETVLIGEVKSGQQPSGPAELRRLDEICAELAPDAVRLLVARTGFTAPLRRLAAARPDVRLADVDTLYGGPLVC